MHRTAFLLALLVLAIQACQVKEEAARLRAISNGQLLYQQHCARCHGPAGQGLEQLYPPLAGADYLATEYDRLACILRYGLADTIVVNGAVYNLPMPANEALFPEDVAQIVTFITNAWGNDTLFAAPPHLVTDSAEAQLARCR